MSVQAKRAVEWLSSLDDALSQAKQTGKVVLLDFFNPG